MLLLKLKKTLRAVWTDTNGSEAVEMVTTTAMLVVFIMVAIMFLSYIVQLNMVNTATKRVVRQIEVTGIANQSTMESSFDRFLGNSAQITNRRVNISNVTYDDSGRQTIQLKSTFRVTGSCTYIIQLINPGSYDGFKIELPIRSTVSGMSEVYWASPRGS